MERPMVQIRAKYRHALPQQGGKLFLTDAGLETCLVFLDGVDLPYFAAFDLLRTEEGAARLRAYYEPFAALAREKAAGFVLESPTWRANPDWAAKLGFDRGELAALNRRSIALMLELRVAYETEDSPMPISGCVGPRGDGYDPSRRMSADEAQDYHAEQIATFRDSGADFVSAITMNYVEEAIGIARAAKAAGMPVVISFTTETDGRLPTGDSLKQAIEAVDAATGAAPAYYMINCAHPTHFESALEEPWVRRVGGLRANASTRSHAELDNATDLDAGDPVGLGRQYRALRHRFGCLNVLGGCCGTDFRHVEQIAFACEELASAA
jgi:S-methylmethionine-dependent homocysteine/selenocysteine methylase